MIFQICSKVLKDGGDAGVQPQEDVGNGKINCLIIDYGVGVWFLFPIVSLFVGIQCENVPVGGGKGTKALLPRGIKGEGGGKDAFLSRLVGPRVSCPQFQVGLQMRTLM